MVNKQKWKRILKSLYDDITMKLLKIYFMIPYDVIILLLLEKIGEIK